MSTLQDLLDQAHHYFQAGDFARAEPLFNQVLSYDPENSTILYFLGVIAHRTNRSEHAIPYFEKSLVRQPNYARCLIDLATALRITGRLDEAAIAADKALALKPDSAAAIATRGIIHADSGQWDAAIRLYRHALSVDPRNAFALANLGAALLAQGHYKEGWDCFEGRMECSGIRRPFGKHFTDPAALSGKTLFIDGEQGFGDYFQFIRYVPLVAALGARVVVGCPRAIISVLKSVPGVSQVITDGDNIPPFDFHCPLMSLPRVFGTTLENIPAEVPYLPLDHAKSNAWVERVGRLRLPGKKVGLVWSGAAKFPKNLSRSTTLAALAPLAKVPDVTFFSLQKGPPAEQAKSPPPGMKLIDFTADLHDFADTAALIEHLDLVVSVCTSVVHLAGGRGRPTWALLSHAADWRWLIGRADSPWYPNTRLFRQPAHGDWASVIGQLADALDQWAH